MLSEVRGVIISRCLYDDHNLAGNDGASGRPHEISEHHSGLIDEYVNKTNTDG